MAVLPRKMKEFGGRRAVNGPHRREESQEKISGLRLAASQRDASVGGGQSASQATRLTGYARRRAARAAS